MREYSNFLDSFSSSLRHLRIAVVLRLLRVALPIVFINLTSGELCLRILLRLSVTALATIDKYCLNSRSSRSFEG